MTQLIQAVSMTRAFCHVCPRLLREQSGKPVLPFFVVLQALVHLTHLRAKFVPRNESFSAKEMFGHDFVPHDYTCEVLQCFSEFRFVHAKKRSTRRTELESFHYAAPQLAPR